MSDIIRTFRVPMGLEERHRRQLEDACGALQARQHAFTTTAPAAVAAHDVNLEGPILRLRYRVEGAQPLIDVRHTADSDSIREWTRQVCVLMGAAYPQGQAAVLKHGCLMSDNVLLDAWGQVRVLDFGVAECVTAVLEPADEFWIRQYASTAAPELWTQPNSWGQASDVFAIGVLLYELASGAHPFGVHREDPEDCKFRMLTEVALPPHHRNAEFAAPLSDIIQRMITRETHARYKAFAEIITDLDKAAHAGAAAADATAASDDAQAGPADDDERRRYLEEQQRLKEERRESTQRQQQKQKQRRARFARWRQFARRHVVGVSICAVLTVAIIIALSMAGVRWRHRAVVDRALHCVASELDARFRDRDGRLCAMALDAEPTPGLIAAFEDLARAAPDAAVAFARPQYADFYGRSGRATLQIGSAAYDIAFKRDAGAVQGVVLEIDIAGLSEAITAASEQRTLAQLPAGARQLATTVRAALGSSRNTAEAAAAFQKHLPAALSQPLGYLGYHGEQSNLVLGAFGPLAEGTGLRARVTLSDADGGDLLQEQVEVQLQMGLDAQDQWRFESVVVEPAEQPLNHQLWCMQRTIAPLRAAFERRDIGALAEAVQASDRSGIERMFAWVAAAANVELVVQGLQASSATANLAVRFDSGIAGAQPMHSRPITLTLDPAQGWSIRKDQSVSWPGAPPALRRAQAAATLIAGFRKAWVDQDAEAYLQLFDDHRRSDEAIRAMFAQIAKDRVSYEITAAIDDQDDTLLLIQVQPETTSRAARQGHISKRFGFRIDQDPPRWDRREDPLWIFAGKNFESLVRRLRSARWHSLAQIEQDFAQTTPQDLSSLERDKIERWIGAINSARRLFEPQSDDYVAGFPVRASLSSGASERLIFRLVPRPDAEHGIVYMQENEFHRDDLGSWWSGRSSPWEPWQALIGPPPNGQVVGVSFDEAHSIAQHFDCVLPTSSEWSAATETFNDTPGRPSPHTFHGGVWEYCHGDSATDPDPADGPWIMGGSWYDFDDALIAAGVPGPQERPLRARQELFGTIGFRLCQRFAVPPEALE